MNDVKYTFEDKANITIQRRNLMYFSSLVIFTAILEVNILPDINLFVLKATIDNIKNGLPLVSVLILSYFIFRHHHERSVSKELIEYKKEFDGKTRENLKALKISNLINWLKGNIKPKQKNLRFDLMISRNVHESLHLDELVYEISGQYTYQKGHETIRTEVNGELAIIMGRDVYRSKIKSFVFIAAHRNYLMELYFPTFYGIVGLIVCIKKLLM